MTTIKTARKASAKMAVKPLDRLRHHVSGAIARGEAEAVVEQAPAPKRAQKPRTLRKAKAPATLEEASKRGAKIAAATAPKPDTRAIVSLAPANRGQDTIAILADKSTHHATKHMAMGIRLAVGDNWDAKHAEYEAALSAEGARRNGLPKGAATLAKGAEREVHSALAAAASRKGQKVHTVTAPAPAARAKKPAPAPKPKATGGSKLDEAAKVIVVAKENPYKPGSKAAATFDLFAKAGTVGGFRALVAKSPSSYDAGYIRYSSRDGYIKFA